MKAEEDKQGWQPGIRVLTKPPACELFEYERPRSSLYFSWTPSFIGSPLHFTMLITSLTYFILFYQCVKWEVLQDLLSLVQVVSLLCIAFIFPVSKKRKTLENKRNHQ